MAGPIQEIHVLWALLLFFSDKGIIKNIEGFGSMEGTHRVEIEKAK